jgi:NitT/TauT family transport system substrate-binding protein
MAAGTGLIAFPSRTVAAQQIRLASIPTESASTPYYSDQAGFFKKANLEVSVESMSNGAAILAAVAGGACEIGGSNPISAAQAIQSGVPITCISPTVYYSSKAPTAALLVAKDSPLKTASDLNGKTIAVNGLRNTTQLAPMAWIDKNGGDSSTVKFVEMNFSVMSQALASGRVDAGLFVEPALIDARKVTRVLANAYDAVAPRFYLGVYVCTNEYAKANPDVVARVADTLTATSTWANSHPHETAVILAKASGVDLTTIETMTRAVYAEHLTADALQPPLDVAAHYGVLKKMNANDMIWQRQRR